jgi:hypothetical protein
MSFLLAAISLGFLGSFHCIGMCGPIAMALPVHHANPLRKTLLILFYNIGRMLTYATLGAAVGAVGQGIAIAGYQQALSISIGVLLLLSLLVPKFISSHGWIGKFISPLFSKLRQSLSQLLKQDGKSSLFTIGLLNGLLPCGLVYMGLAGAAATGAIWKGALFMFVFGSGTLPVMLSLPLAGSFITVDTRNRIRKTVPVIIGITAVLLIFRGLNLGIPFVSPSLDKQSNSVSCHGGGDTHLQNSISCSGQNSVHKK